jgi:ribosome-associated protein
MTTTNSNDIHSGLLNTERLLVSRQIALECARVTHDSRGRDSTVLDLTGIHPEYDYFVIVTAISMRQMQAMCDEVREQLRVHGHRTYSIEGMNTDWMVMDLGDVLVHMFLPDARENYDLERLYADAEELDLISA